MFILLSVGNSWITNETGDFCAEDTESNCRVWVPKNAIHFNEANEPIMIGQNGIPKLIGVKEVGSEKIHKSEPEDSAPSEDLDNDERSRKNKWSLNDTYALIDAIESRFEDMRNEEKRKEFWSIICEDLNSLDINFSESACKQKWFNLMRTYRTTKNRRGPTKFPYFDRMKNLLNDVPIKRGRSPVENMVRPGSRKIPKEEGTTDKTDPVIAETSWPKRISPTRDMVKAKQQYFEAKLEYLKKQETKQLICFKRKLKYKEEKLALTRMKLELEKRKVKALEELNEILRKKGFNQSLS